MSYSSAENWGGGEKEWSGDLGATDECTSVNDCYHNPMEETRTLKGNKKNKRMNTADEGLVTGKERCGVWRGRGEKGKS